MQTDYRRKLVHMNALPMNKLTRVALVAILALMGTAPACGQALGKNKAVVKRVPFLGVTKRQR